MNLSMGLQTPLPEAEVYPTRRGHPEAITPVHANVIRTEVGVAVCCGEQG